METKLLFLALIPGILIIIYIFRKDKVEHEPWPLLIKLLIFGAISCIPAMFAEQFMSSVAPTQDPIPYAIYEAFLVAALCEEFFKYVLLRLGSWRNRNFDYRFDGIVYGVSVAVGFALLENVLYVMEGGVYVALMRGVLAVPLHAFCGVFMGVFYGAAKRYSIEGRHSQSLRATLMALIVPMIIHGIYDSLAFLGEYGTTIVLLAFVLFMYIVAIRVVNKFSREDWSAAFYRQNLAGNDAIDGEK
jgi:Predicted membrane protein